MTDEHRRPTAPGAVLPDPSASAVRCVESMHAASERLWSQALSEGPRSQDFVFALMAHLLDARLSTLLFSDLPSEFDRQVHHDAAKPDDRVDIDPRSLLRTTRAHLLELADAPHGLLADLESLVREVADHAAD